MTQTNPYRPSQADLRDVDDDVLLPTGWKRAWMSLAISYSAVLPFWAFVAISAFHTSEPLREFLIMPFFLMFFGSFVIIPSWFLVFLPVVLIADPKSHWVRSSRLTVFGAAVGCGWGVLANMDPDSEVPIVFVLLVCGALPGFLFGRWNDRFLTRKSHA